jgi:hypothetical protein
LTYDFREERREARRWYWWALGLLVAGGVILTALSYAGLIGRTVVERKVFEESFQYSEARKAAIATYEAQLIEIDARLAMDITDQERRALVTQRSVVNARLTAEKARRDD